MFTEGLGLYSFRLYLSWMLKATSGIGIRNYVGLHDAGSGRTYEAMQDTHCLSLLPVTAYLCGWVNGYFRAG